MVLDAAEQAGAPGRLSRWNLHVLPFMYYRPAAVLYCMATAKLTTPTLYPPPPKRAKTTIANLFASCRALCAMRPSRMKCYWRGRSPIIGEWVIGDAAAMEFLATMSLMRHPPRASCVTHPDPDPEPAPAPVPGPSRCGRSCGSSLALALAPALALALASSQPTAATSTSCGHLNGMMPCHLNQMADGGGRLHDQHNVRAPLAGTYVDRESRSLRNGAPRASGSWRSSAQRVRRLCAHKLHKQGLRKCKSAGQGFPLLWCRGRP